MKNFNETKKEFIKWILWIKYNKDEMSNDEFEYVAEKLTNDTMLENDLMPMILGSAKFYSNEFKRNNMEGK